MNWLSNNYKWLLDGLGGLLIVAVLDWARRRREKLKSSSSYNSPKVTGGSGNNQTAIEIHNARDVSIQHKGPEPTGAVPAKPNRSVRPKPNVAFLRARMAWVEEGLYNVFRESDSGSPVRALLACFRNEPVYEQNVADATSVAAHFVYRDSHGQEIGEGASNGCWLNTLGGAVDIGVGESKCAILMLTDGNKSFVPYRAFTQTSWGTGVTTHAHQFAEPIATIEVRLLDGRNDLLLPPLILEFSDRDGVLSATRRIQHAGL